MQSSRQQGVLHQQLLYHFLIFLFHSASIPNCCIHDETDLSQRTLRLKRKMTKEQKKAVAKRRARAEAKARKDGKKAACFYKTWVRKWIKH
jgi:hypothetical protein